jgi:hypothetical protein
MAPESETRMSSLGIQKGMRVTGFLVVLLALGLFASGCGSGASGYVATDRSAATRPESGRNYANDVRLNGLAADAAPSISRAIRSRPDWVYVEIVPTGLEIGLTDDSPATEAMARRADAERAHPIPLRFRQVTYSARQLNAVERQLNRSYRSLARSGVHMTDWGPDEDSNTILVHLHPYTDVAAERLRWEYGAIVSVKAGPRARAD